MKKFTTVILILSLVCLVSGMILCGIGIASGANATELAGLIKEGRYTFGWNSYDSGEDDKDIEKTEQTFQNADIRSLNVDIDAGSLDILDSWDDDIHVNVKARNVTVRVNDDGGTLEIKGDSTKHWWFARRQKCEIKLYLPENKEWTEADFELGAGSLTSELSELNVRNLDITVGAGEAVISHDIHVQQKASLEVDAGQITMGNIAAEKVSVNVGVGEIGVTADVGEKLSADCGVGELDLKLTGSMTDYNYKVDCGLGEVRIGTETMTSLGNDRHINHHAAKDVEIDCGVGTVSVSFEE